MSNLDIILLGLLIFTNWCWWLFFKNYRETVISEVKRLRSEAPAPWRTLHVTRTSPSNHKEKI